MTRIINRKADVTTGPGGAPLSFRCDGGRHRVRAVLDTWHEAGRWWEQEGETVSYRVATADGGVFELTREVTTNLWHLYKAYD